MATVFWETAAIFLEEFLKSGTTIIGWDTKEIKTTNSKGSTKDEDE
jgi:hypothetical protein